MVALHPPYSLYLVLCNFWTHPKVKTTMKGKHFESIQGIQGAVELKSLTGKDFKNCFSKCQEYGYTY